MLNYGRDYDGSDAFADEDGQVHTDAVPIGGDTSSQAQKPIVGTEEDLDDQDKDKGKGKASSATRLVQLAEDQYELGCTPDGEPYGIPSTGPQIIRQLRGGRSSLRAELARAYYTEYGSAPSQSALADALAVLEGKATHEVEPVELHLRVADHDGALLVDIGDQTGRAIEITSNGWSIVEFPPVRFRRTALTAPLPDPIRGQSFEPLWNALNVKAHYRPIVLATLVASFIPSIPHPVVLISGEHGTGKTTATNRLGSVVDPNTVGPRKAPRDAEQWVITASASWVICLDNLSQLPEWLSDAMCRAATGEGDARRRLYSDSDLAVFKFRRILIMNGIDLGAMRGDLSDRLVHIVLERIPDSARRTETDMTEQWADAHPRTLGALLDLTVKVLSALPDINLTSMPRMADFARVLAAVDQVCGTDGMSVYLNLREEQAEEIAESDPVIVQLRAVVVGEVTVTAGELLDAIYPVDDAGVKMDERRLAKDWPSTARKLTAHLHRIAPTLRQLGWACESIRGGAGRAGRQVRWHLEPPSTGGDPSLPGNDATDATTRPDHEYPQVKPDEEGVASSVALPSQRNTDATRSHHTTRRDGNATNDATGHRQHLTSENSATGRVVASVASNTGNLCATCDRTVGASLMPDGQCRRCHFANRVGVA